MTVQSNVSGGAAVAPVPRGNEGLGALSAGFNGATSDVVVAGFPADVVNIPFDSFDLIFSSATQISGVGFNPVSFFAATEELTISVFNTTNVLLGVTISAADPAGTNFFGIQATSGDLIGRINLFGRGLFEGADNVSLFRAAAAVPEPRSLALLVIGVTLLGITRRRNKKHSFAVDE